MWQQERARERMRWWGRERESVCLREGRRERQGTCVVSTYTAHCCVSEQSEKRYKGEGRSRQERRRAVWEREKVREAMKSSSEALGNELKISFNLGWKTGNAVCQRWNMRLQAACKQTCTAAGLGSKIIRSIRQDRFVSGLSILIICVTWKHFFPLFWFPDRKLYQLSSLLLRFGKQITVLIHNLSGETLEDSWSLEKRSFWQKPI